jgi:enamine deaminase RidA (YjgF/YER057c/UK114 family)
MTFRSLPTRLLPLLLASALAVGCAAKDEQQARKAIDRIDAAIETAGPDATKYIPGQVRSARSAVDQLKIRFYDRDYKGVIDAAAPVLAKAQALPTAASTRKAEVAKSLESVWAELTTSAPAALAAVERQADELLKSNKAPPGMTREMVESSKVGIAELKALWQKALAAKAAGSIEEAVTLGAHAQRRAENLLAALARTSS